MPVIEFSSEALCAFKRRLDGVGHAACYRFRLGVRGGGCSGFSYDISWDVGDDREGDVAWEASDPAGTRPVRFVVDARSVRLLQGTRVG